MCKKYFKSIALVALSVLLCLTALCGCGKEKIDLTGRYKWENEDDVSEVLMLTQNTDNSGNYIWHLEEGYSEVTYNGVWELQKDNVLKIEVDDAKHCFDAYFLIEDGNLKCVEITNESISEDEFDEWFEDCIEWRKARNWDWGIYEKQANHDYK